MLPRAQASVVDRLRNANEVTAATAKVLLSLCRAPCTYIPTTTTGAQRLEDAHHYCCWQQSPVGSVMLNLLLKPWCEQEPRSPNLPTCCSYCPKTLAWARKKKKTKQNFFHPSSDLPLNIFHRPQVMLNHNLSGKGVIAISFVVFLL